MEIQLNGKPLKLERELSARELVAFCKLDPKGVALEINGEILPGDRWDATVLKRGDRVVMLSFVGGG